MPKKKSPNSVRIRNSTAEFLTFAYQTGGDGVEVRVEEGTIWLSQKSMGQLFETTPENVLMHLKNIFAENELEQDSVAKVFLATAADGKNYRIKHYNLDAIIAVGYRVNSKRATAFRQWATGVLRDYASEKTMPIPDAVAAQLQDYDPGADEASPTTYLETLHTRLQATDLPQKLLAIPEKSPDLLGVILKEGKV